jgi:putative ABC transport system ATP-binding protein
MSRLDVTDLVVEYLSEGYAIRPVDGLSFGVSDGEMALLLGPSGSGKTSVLSCLGGLLRVTAGRIVCSGRDLSAMSATDLVEHRRTGVGIVFQAFNLVPSLTARENVAAPLLLTGSDRRTALGRADELLDLVGLADRRTFRPAQLSGGQQQRVAIARALVADPPILLADEPTANLDHVQAEDVIALLRSLRDRGRVVVVSTHDQRLVPVADQVVSLVQRDATAPDTAQVVEYHAGEIIFAQGSHGSVVYVIERGEVAIERELADGSSEPLAILDEGTYFGELGAMLGFVRSATARAVTDVVLTAYGVREFRGWLERSGRSAAGRASAVTAPGFV